MDVATHMLLTFLVIVTSKMLNVALIEEVINRFSL